jgi:hypothetical protein
VIVCVADANHEQTRQSDTLACSQELSCSWFLVLVVLVSYMFSSLSKDEGMDVSINCQLFALSFSQQLIVCIDQTVTVNCIHLVVVVSGRFSREEPSVPVSTGNAHVGRPCQKLMIYAEIRQPSTYPCWKPTKQNRYRVLPSPGGSISQMFLKKRIMCLCFTPPEQVHPLAG